jgi:hypothetical protein
MGNCLQFSGASGNYAYLGNGDFMDGVSDFTIEFWFKTTDATAQQSVMHYENDSQMCFYANISYANGGMEYRAPNWHSAEVNISNNVWHYVAITRNTSNSKCYFDAAVETNEAESGNMPIGQYEFWFAQDVDYPFIGKLCEVRISNCVRTQEEITAAWNSGNGQRFTADANTLVLLHMDEGSGYPQDSSGNDDDVVGMGAACTWAADSPAFSSTQTLTPSGVASAEAIAPRRSSPAPSMWPPAPSPAPRPSAVRQWPPAPCRLLPLLSPAWKPSAAMRSTLAR